MAIRIAFLKSNDYVSVEIEGKQPVKVNNIYAAILLMRMVWGEHPAKRVDATFPSINRDDIYRLFKNDDYRHRATSYLRNILGNKAADAEYRIFVEDKNVRKTSYRLEFGNKKASIDLINLVNLLHEADQCEWNSAQIWRAIQHWNQEYSMDFVSKLETKSKVEDDELSALECVVWAKDQCEYLQKTLSAIFDKYVLCLMAENWWDRAEDFVRDEWLGKLDSIYSQIDEANPIHDIRIWPYFRMIQIMYWRRQGHIEDYYRNRRKQLENTTSYPGILETFIEYIQKNSLERPGGPTDPRWLIPSENFDSEASDWIWDHTLLKELKNQPPYLQGFDSQRPEHLFLKTDDYQLSKPFAAPSLRATERNILLQTIENATEQHFRKAGADKTLRLQKRLDLDCQLNASELLTSREVHKRFINNHWVRLLILGQPGAGKSYLLYEMAEDLLKMARVNPSAKVPLPLSLKKWDAEFDSFESWVKDAMMRQLTNYKEAADWVDEGRVILLLDGINEIVPNERATFISALEKYLLNHQRASITRCVITCRQQDYWAGPTFDPDISFDQILIKPLSDKQIHDFLSRKGSK